MKFKENANKVIVDETCNLEVEVSRFSEDGMTFGKPLVCISRNIIVDGEWRNVPMLLSPAKAIKLAELLRNCGKEAYAQRIEED